MAKTTKNTTTPQATSQATTATAPAMSTQEFNSLFPSTQGLVGTHTSIYKAALFDGVATEKEKKSRRRKLRNQRDNFLGNWLSCKNDAKKVEEIKKDWKEYAAKVYVNVNQIFESNTSAETQELCKKFIKAMGE